MLNATNNSCLLEPFSRVAGQVFVFFALMVAAADIVSPGDHHCLYQASRHQTSSS
jgi:hypothetical protein